MPRKKETLTLSVPPGTKEKLEVIAERLNIRWGNNPSPSGLVAAIAQQEVEVAKSFKLNPTQVKALRQSVRALIDAGCIEEAKSVITVLLGHGDLEIPLRRSLVLQISQPLEGWRIKLDDLIAQRQPFSLFYQDSQNRSLEFTVRYAEVIFYEKRYYLQIWCEETEDSTDIPKLQHNRCLRLDRIQGIFETSGGWRGCFDSIEVQLHFKNWLIKAYEPKDADVHDEVIGNIRRVIRTVVNPFWLTREIRRYGPDCVIISPQEVRDRFKQELLAMVDQY